MSSSECQDLCLRAERNSVEALSTDINSTEKNRQVSKIWGRGLVKCWPLAGVGTLKFPTILLTLCHIMSTVKRLSSSTNLGAVSQSALCFAIVKPSVFEQRVTQSGLCLRTETRLKKKNKTCTRPRVLTIVPSGHSRVLHIKLTLPSQLDGNSAEENRQ